MVNAPFSDFRSTSAVVVEARLRMRFNRAYEGVGQGVCEGGGY